MEISGEGVSSTTSRGPMGNLDREVLLGLLVSIKVQLDGKLKVRIDGKNIRVCPLRKTKEGGSDDLTDRFHSF